MGFKDEKDIESASKEPNRNTDVVITNNCVAKISIVSIREYEKFFSSWRIWGLIEDGI